MRISDWSSDVCSSDLWGHLLFSASDWTMTLVAKRCAMRPKSEGPRTRAKDSISTNRAPVRRPNRAVKSAEPAPVEIRSEEHTSELQSLMRISYAVFCLKKKKTKTQQ